MLDPFLPAVLVITKVIAALLVGRLQQFEFGRLPAQAARVEIPLNQFVRCWEFAQRFRFGSHARFLVVFDEQVTI
ncbi:MAG: hypothetical protein FJ403_11530 [Verrucomicrobia bacterium]|nr:hypothetical protein [Verrucomicrobiota bacterium]